jgi:hypothetical protein
MDTKIVVTILLFLSLRICIPKILDYFIARAWIFYVRIFFNLIFLFIICLETVFNAESAFKMIKGVYNLFIFNEKLNKNEGLCVA